MTEADWLKEYQNPQAMIWTFRGTKTTRTKAGKRKLRLFACGCCRLIWKLLPDEPFREVVEVAERFAEANAVKEELATAYDRAGLVGIVHFFPRAPDAPANTAAALARATARPSALDTAFYMTAYPLALAGFTLGEKDGNAVTCDLLRCVFGNPFRPVALDVGWRRWNDGTIPKLARSIYDDRAFEQLPILADALEDAGCVNSDMINHCRGPGPHVRGCWVVDLILGKS
jgi:hypothetical protein